MPGRPTRRLITISQYSVMLASESLVLFSGCSPPKKLQPKKQVLITNLVRVI
jgi:hypothetical protein